MVRGFLFCETKERLIAAMHNNYKWNMQNVTKVVTITMNMNPLLYHAIVLYAF